MDELALSTVLQVASGRNPTRCEEQLVALRVAARDPFSAWASPFWQDDARLRRRVLLASARLDRPLAEPISPAGDTSPIDETVLLSLLDGLGPASPPPFSVEAAVTTLNAVEGFVRTGSWSVRRVPREIRALQRGVERAAGNVAPTASRSPGMLAVVVCLSVRGEDVLNASGAATDRLHERLPPATASDAALPAVGPAAAGARDLLAHGTLRGENAAPRWDDERAARLQFERDLAIREPIGDGTRRRIRRTRVLVRGLPVLQRLQHAHQARIRAWAARVAGIDTGTLTFPRSP
jgi:hypothetical protein